MASREFSPADRYLNNLAVKAPGLVFLALYGVWLVLIGIWGAVVERRCMTRKLPRR